MLKLLRLLNVVLSLLSPKQSRLAVVLVHVHFHFDLTICIMVLDTEQCQFLKTDQKTEQFFNLWSRLGGMRQETPNKNMNSVKELKVRSNKL